MNPLEIKSDEVVRHFFETYSLSSAIRWTSHRRLYATQRRAIRRGAEPRSALGGRLRFKVTILQVGRLRTGRGGDYCAADDDAGESSARVSSPDRASWRAGQFYSFFFAASGELTRYGSRVAQS